MVICINHQKGGVGKSTLAWNLAIELSKEISVEVVDLDVQQTVTLNNYVRKNVGLDSLKVRTFNDNKSFTKYLETDDDKKIILCDTGAYDSNLNRLAAAVADFLITPLSNSTVELQGLKMYEKIIKELKSGGADIRPNVVLNNIDPRSKNFDELRKFITESGTFELLDTIICRRLDFVHSISNGKSVVEYNESSRSSAEMKSLTKEIKEKLWGKN